MIEKISDKGKVSEKQSTTSSEFAKIEKIAGSVFDKLNTDKNAALDVAEAIKGGLTSLGDKDISKEDFINFYLEQAQKTTTLPDCINDFEKQLCSFGNGKYIFNVDISHEQRNELVRRIELFKLAQPKLKEDFKVNKKYLEDVLEALKNDEPVTNETIGRIIFCTNLNRSLVNGKIGPIKQGNLGDCWFLSQMNCYASSEDGAKNIQDRIVDNGNGVYTVIFQNPFNPDKQENYYVHEQTLKSKKDKKVSGTKNMQILEVAFSIYLEKYASAKEKKSEEGFLRSGTLVKEYLLHRALGYTGDIVKYFKKGDKMYESFSHNWEGADGKLSNLSLYTWGKYSSFRDTIKNNNLKETNLICATPLKGPQGLTQEEQKILILQHGYNLMKSSDDVSTINNPHLSSFPVTLSNQKFQEVMHEVTYLDTKERIPCSKEKKSSTYEKPNIVLGKITSASEYIWGNAKLSAKWLYKTIANAF